MSSGRICSRCGNQGEGFSDDFLECRRCQYFRSLHNNNIAHAQFKKCTLCLNPDQTPEVTPNVLTTQSEHDDMPPLEDIPTTPTTAPTTAPTTTTPTTTPTTTTSRWWFW